MSRKNTWTNQPKFSCIDCGKQLYTSYIKSHQKTCNKSRKKFTNNKLNIDYVICPICDKKLIELNTSHLKKHNHPTKSFDVTYPDYPRLSKKAIENKNGFKNLTEEISNKLKFSQTKEGYIKKYGESIGREKWIARKENFSKARTLEGYIEKFGLDDGTSKYTKACENKASSLNTFIGKYGLEEGQKRYDKWCNTSSLKYFMEKYGEIEGKRKWFLKNKKNSESSRHVPLANKKEYEVYCSEVDKYTNLSIKFFPLENIELRSRNFHLDHKVSKCFGFKNSLMPYIIGSIHNLEIIHSSVNCKKQTKCSMDSVSLSEIVTTDQKYMELVTIFRSP